MMSRLFLYWNARDDKTQDTGSALKDCIDGVTKYGACLEKLWPYDTTKFTVKPPSAAWKEAVHRSQGLAYAKITSLKDMQHCLMQGFPFVFGMSLFGPFEELSGPDCILPMPTDSDEFLGGHALCCVGMSLKKQAFLVRNSWGPDWGDKGYFWLPFKYAADSQLVDDLWTIRKING